MLPTVDLVRVGISVAVACLLCTLRLRLVLWTDTIFSVLSGAYTIYFAKYELGQFCGGTTPIDAQHVFILATRVVLMLMPAIVWLICRTTVDITCRTAITLSRLVCHAGSAVVMIADQYRLDKFTESHLLHAFIPSLLWALVMAVQLVRTGSRVNIHIRRIDINKFLHIDLSLMVLMALLDLVSPGTVGRMMVRDESANQSLSKELLALRYCEHATNSRSLGVPTQHGHEMDFLHVYLHRVNGCQYLGMAIIPWIGQRFRYVEDKHGILLARILTVLIWFGGAGYVIATRLLPIDLGFILIISQMALQLVPALIGNIICQNGPLSAAFWNSQRKAVSIEPARS